MTAAITEAVTADIDRYVRDAARAWGLPGQALELVEADLPPAVFADGALPEQTKQLIAVAVAHVTQCPYCIQGHTALALRSGNTQEQIMEAIWVAAEMRAGASYAHALKAVQAMGGAG